MPRTYRDAVDADALRVLSAPKDNCRIVECMNQNGSISQTFGFV